MSDKKKRTSKKLSSHPIPKKLMGTEKRLNKNKKNGEFDKRHCGHSEDTIEAIRRSIQKRNIIKRLEKHLIGDPFEHTGLSATQLKAAEILLKKCMPDLSSVAIGNEDGTPLVIQWEK